MAQNVTLLGASYPDVPQVVLPKTGGGMAAFTDVSDSTAGTGDVIEGQVFYQAGGQRSVGALGDATQSAHGLMSAADKTKLDGLDASAYLKKAGDTATGKITFNKGIRQIYTGTGTPGQAGSSSAAYVPSLWKYNLGMTPVEGDIITVKIPVAGVNAGVWVSVDNGAHYYPVATNNKSILTTHYAVDNEIMLIYQTGMVTSMRGNSISGAPAGAANADVTMDRWCVINFYDSNTTYSPATLGSGYGTCATAAATAAKVVTLGSYSLVTGGIIAVKFTYDVPANATLNVNSKGAKNIYYKGAKITAGVLKAGDVGVFIYSSYYHLIAIDRMQKVTNGGPTLSWGNTATVGNVGGVDLTVTMPGLSGILDYFYPVGTIYSSMSSTAPAFGGTWREIIYTSTYEQLKTGEHGFRVGASSGPVHHWQRIA